MHGQPTGAIRVCPASSEADSSWLSSRMRSTTWATGASGATRWATCCERLARLHLDHGERVGHRRRWAGGADDPPNCATTPSHDGDQCGEQRKPDGGGGCDRASAVRGAGHHHTGAAVAHRSPARPRPTRAAFAPGPTGGKAAAATGPARTSRVSRIVICLAFRSSGSLLCSNSSRSGVRLIEHVIELLQNDRTGHRQIFRRGRPRRRKSRHASNTCLIIERSATTFGAMSEDRTGTTAKAQPGAPTATIGADRRRPDRAAAHDSAGHPRLGDQPRVSPEHPGDRRRGGSDVHLVGRASAAHAGAEGLPAPRSESATRGRRPRCR